MSDASKIIVRLTDRGTIIFLVGVVIVYLAGILARKCTDDEEKQTTYSIALKLVGCVVAVVGILILFGFVA